MRDGKNGSDTSGRVGNRTQNPNLGLLYFDEDAADIADEKIKATVQTEGIEFNLFGVNYSFTNNASVVSWVSDDGQNKTALVNERGSIAYTRKLLRQFLSNKPKIASSDLREYLNDQLVRLQTHVSNVASGKFDNIIRAVTSTSLSWTLQDNTQYTVIFSLAASGISKANGFIFDGDTTPRTPKEQIDEVRARYKTTIRKIQGLLQDQRQFKFLSVANRHAGHIIQHVLHRCQRGTASINIYSISATEHLQRRCHGEQRQHQDQSTTGVLFSEQDDHRGRLQRGSPVSITGDHQDKISEQKRQRHQQI